MREITWLDHLAAADGGQEGLFRMTVGSRREDGM